MTISAFPRPRSALSPDAWKRQGRDNRRCRGANLQRSACGPDCRALNTHPNVEGVEECSNGSSSESRSHPKAWLRFGRQLACSSRTDDSSSRRWLTWRSPWTRDGRRRKCWKTSRAKLERRSAPHWRRHLAPRRCSSMARPRTRCSRRHGAEGADLVAVGTHGGSRAKGILLGSVATLMLHEAPCPVLIARPSKTMREFPRSYLRGRGRFAGLGPALRRSLANLPSVSTLTLAKSRRLWRDEDRSRRRFGPSSPTRSWMIDRRSKRSSSEQPRQTRTCLWSGAEACMVWRRLEA